MHLITPNKKINNFFYWLIRIIINLLLILDNGPCLGWREFDSKSYQWLNYNETLLRAKNFGSGIVELGLLPGPETFVGIYSQNCPEWVLTEQAVYCYSMVLVPLYDTLGPDACAFIIKQGKCFVKRSSSFLCDFYIISSLGLTILFPMHWLF